MTPSDGWRCCRISNFNGYKPDCPIFLVPEAVDFRKSVDGLAVYVQEVLQRSPMDKGCFLFSNKEHNKIKILEWDYNGFWLCYKRLESGRFVWPSSGDEVLAITRDQYDHMMNGLSISQRDGFGEVLARKVV